MNKYEKYKSGTIEVTVDGDIWKIKPSLNEIAKLATPDPAKAKTEEGFKSMVNTVIEMVVAGEGEEHREIVENFVTQKVDKVIEEMIVTMGWKTREEVDNEKKRIENQLTEKEKSPSDSGS